MSQRHFLRGTTAGLVMYVAGLLLGPAVAQVNPEPSISPPLPLDALPPGAVARLGTTNFWQGAPIRALAFAPGDKVLACYSDDNKICLWDAQTGKRLQLLEVPPARVEPIKERVNMTYTGDVLVFSGDGKRLGFADAGSRSYRVWDVASGKEMQQIPMEFVEMEIVLPPGMIGPGAALPKRLTAGPFSLSWDGRLLVTASGMDHTIAVWDLATKKERARLKGHHGRINVVVVAPEGKVLASGGEDQLIRLWDLASGKEIRSLRGHRSGVQELAFAPNGKRLVSAGNDGMLRLWDPDTGKSLLQTRWRPPIAGEAVVDPDGYPYSARLTATLHALWMDAAAKEMGCYFSMGSTNVPGNQDMVVRFDAATGQEIFRRVHYSPYTTVTSTYYSPFATNTRPTISYKPYALGRERGLIARGSSSYHIQLFDLATGEEVGNGPGMSSSCADVEMAGSVVALTRQNDNAVYLWDWQSPAAPAPGAKLLRRLEGHTGQPIFTGFTPDGKQLLSCSRDISDRSISVWDVSRGEEVRQITTWNHGSTTRRITTTQTTPSFSNPILSGDGKLLALRGNDGQLRVVEVASGHDVATFNFKWQGEGSVAFTPDSQQVVVGDCKEERQFLPAGGEQRNLHSFLHLFDVKTGKKIKQVNTQTFNFVFTRIYVAGRLALLACKDGAIRTVDLVTGQEGRMIGDGPKVEGPPPGFPPGAWIPPQVNRAPFFLLSPDRRTVAVRLDNNSLRLIEVATGKERSHFKGQRSTIGCMGFSPDGCYLVSGSNDSTVVVWAVLSPATKPGAFPGLTPPAQELTDKEQDDLWSDLGNMDGYKGLAALQKLSAAPETAVKLLQARLKAFVPLKPEMIEQKIRDLDSPHYATREKAYKVLLDMGDMIRLRLEKAAETASSTEMKNRIQQILDRFSQSPIRGEQVREVRGVELLEALASAPAIDLLRTFASGPTDARLTLEAQEALARLRQRGVIP